MAYIFHHAWVDPPRALLLLVRGGDWVGEVEPVAGCYVQILGEAMHGMPVWKCGPRRLYANDHGYWVFAKSMEDVESRYGYVFSLLPHGGRLPHEVETWQVGSDEEGHRQEKRIRCCKVPLALHLTAPDRGGCENNVVGSYALQPELCSDMPVWVSKRRRLYCVSSGYWVFTRGPDIGTNGDVFSTEPHLGRLPDEMPGRWQVGLGQGEGGNRYRVDEDIQVREVPKVMVLGARGVPSSAIGRYELYQSPEKCECLSWEPVWGRGDWRMLYNEQGRWSVRGQGGAANQILYAVHEGKCKLPHDQRSWHRRFRQTVDGTYGEFLLDPAVQVSLFEWECPRCTLHNVAVSLCGECGGPAPPETDAAHPSCPAVGVPGECAGGAGSIVGALMLQSAAALLSDSKSPAPVASRKTQESPPPVSVAAAVPDMTCSVCQDVGAKASGIECDAGHWTCAECSVLQIEVFLAHDMRASFAADEGVACPVRHVGDDASFQQRLPPQRIAALVPSDLWSRYERARAEVVESALLKEQRAQHLDVVGAIVTEQGRMDVIVKHLVEEVLIFPLVRCPSCGVHFDSFADCFAVDCGSCGSHFCAYCHYVAPTMARVKQHIAAVGAEGCAVIHELGCDPEHALFPDGQARDTLWVRAQVTRTRLRVGALLGGLPEDSATRVWRRVHPNYCRLAEHALREGVDISGEPWILVQPNGAAKLQKRQLEFPKRADQPGRPRIEPPD